MGSLGPHQIRRAAASGGSLKEQGRVAVAKLDEGGQQLYDNPGSEPIRLHRAGECDPLSAVNVRYRPAGE
jgi:hypothetical protein